MQRDYGPSRRTRSPTTPRKRRKSPNSAARTTPVQAKLVRFHGPSFTLGILFSGIALAGWFWMPEEVVTHVSTGVQSESDNSDTDRADTVFSFPDILADQTVPPRPENYPLSEEDSRQGPIMVQAASFRAAADADRLRATLILEGLKAEVRKATVGTTTWHKVVTGPYPRKVDARRAITQMRHNKLSPMMFNDPLEE